MTKRELAVWAGMGLGAILLYLGCLREMVSQSFYGTAPDWFMTLVNAVYPRFSVEKHRFDMPFFLHHADQVVIRFGLLYGLVTTCILLKNKTSVPNSWLRFWEIQASPTKIRVYAWAVYSCVLYFSYDWYWSLEQLHRARDFYKPLLILRVLHVPFPSLPVIGFLCSVLIISCVGVVFRFREILFSVMVAVLFTLLQAWIYSFEKIDHAFAPLTYVLWLMPLLLRQSANEQPLWALQLIRVVIGVIYLQAGLEKVLLSGLEWFSPDTFRTYLYLHPTAAGLWVARYDGLCVVLPFLALLFQLSFISILFFPKMRWVLLPAGILFHAGTFVLMGIGGVVNAWVWMYVLYL